MTHSIELEINNLPAAPEGGVWLWGQDKEPRATYQHLTLVIGEQKWFKYINGTTNDVFINAGNSLISQYKAARRLELLTHGAVRLVPAALKVKEVKYD